SPFYRKNNPRRSGGGVSETHDLYLRRRLPARKEIPNMNAFCRIAPSVRRIIRPIFRAGVVFASDLSCRTSPESQGTLFRRAAMIRPHIVWSNLEILPFSAHCNNYLITWLLTNWLKW